MKILKGKIMARDFPADSFLAALLPSGSMWKFYGRQTNHIGGYQYLWFRENRNIALLQPGAKSLWAMTKRNSFPQTTQLMETADYVIKKGMEHEMPVAVNISCGTNYGDHAGTFLLETYLNDAAQYWKSAICVGSGNEGLGLRMPPAICRVMGSRLPTACDILFPFLFLSLSFWFPFKKYNSFIS